MSFTPRPWAPGDGLPSHDKQQPTKETIDGQEAITLSVTLTTAEAWEFAQFLKRAGYENYRVCATSQDEAYLMINAGSRIRKSLAEKGFSPR